MFHRSMLTGWALWLDDMRDPADFLRSRMVTFDGYTFRKMTFPEFECYVDAGWQATDFKWAKSADQAKVMVKRYGMPEFMALDHDLGNHDVFAFLRWLSAEEQKELGKVLAVPYWNAHSANPVGCQNIDSFMRSWHMSVRVEIDSHHGG